MLNSVLHLHSLDNGKNLIIQVVDLGQGEGHCQMSDFRGRPQLFVRLDLTHISPHSNHWWTVFAPVFAVIGVADLTGGHLKFLPWIYVFPRGWVSAVVPTLWRT